jgi:hypothetical protein
MLHLEVSSCQRPVLQWHMYDTRDQLCHVYAASCTQQHMVLDVAQQRALVPWGVSCDGVWRMGAFAFHRGGSNRTGGRHYTSFTSCEVPAGYCPVGSELCG